MQENVAFIAAFCSSWSVASADAGGFDCKSVTEQYPSSVAVQPTHLPGSESFTYETIGDVSLRLHIFNPPYHQPSAKSAAIVFFFGGGWIFGTVQQFVPQA